MIQASTAFELGLLSDLSVQLGAMRLAVTNLTQLGIDPRGSGYALGLIQRAEALVEPRGFMDRARCWWKDTINYGSSWSRVTKAREYALEAKEWLWERGVGIDSNRFYVGRGGIRQPLTLGQELKYCALGAPLCFAALGVLFAAIPLTEIAPTVRELRNWRTLDTGQKRDLVIGVGLGSLFVPFYPVVAGVACFVSLLGLGVGPLLGTAVALSRYSQGRAIELSID